MNEALVNAPNGFAPSYDIGGTAEWQVGNWDITAMGMNVGKNDFDCSQVAEAYWRVVLNNYFAVTADLQYMKDKYDTGRDDLKGFIGGLRMTAEF